MQSDQPDLDPQPSDETERMQWEAEDLAEAAYQRGLAEGRAERDVAALHAYELGLAEGRRQTTEGWERHWGVANEHEVHPATNRADAEEWSLLPGWGYVVSRLVGPWEPADPAPQGDVPTVPVRPAADVVAGAAGIASEVPGCPACRTILNAERAGCTGPWHWGNGATDTDPITSEVYGEFFPERGDDGQPLHAEQREGTAEQAIAREVARELLTIIPAAIREDVARGRDEDDRLMLAEIFEAAKPLVGNPVARPLVLPIAKLAQHMYRAATAEPATGGVVDPGAFAEPNGGCVLPTTRPIDRNRALDRPARDAYGFGALLAGRVVDPAPALTAEDGRTSGGGGMADDLAIMSPARIRVRHDPGALMGEPDLYGKEDDHG